MSKTNDITAQICNKPKKLSCSDIPDRLKKEINKLETKIMIAQNKNNSFTIHPLRELADLENTKLKDDNLKYFPVLNMALKYNIFVQ